MATRDAVVAGVHVPAGVSPLAYHSVTLRGLADIKKTIVGTQNYTIQRDEGAFPDAESFVPDRWLSEKNDEARKEAFIPFSVGSRSCIGIK